MKKTTKRFAYLGLNQQKTQKKGLTKYFIFSGKHDKTLSEARSKPHQILSQPEEPMLSHPDIFQQVLWMC